MGWEDRVTVFLFGSGGLLLLALAALLMKLVIFGTVE